MHKNNNILPVASLLCFTLPAYAGGFLDDSQASLRSQNFYLNRDFREGTGISKREEWAQGFILDFRSGYTLGAVGFGVDAIGMLGLKLDSSPGRSGTGLLPVADDGQAPDQYSKFGVTGKARLSNTELKIGTQLLKYPTIASSTGRILPQTFQGGVLTSKELDSLTLTYAQINRTTKRDYSHSEAMSLVNKNGRFRGTPEADDFRMGGVDYVVNPNLSLSYQYGELDEVYGQHYLGLFGSTALGPGKLVFDARYFISDDKGQAMAGRVDNRALNLLLSYSQAGHTFGAAYQGLSGTTAMPYLIGTDAYLTNYMMAADFMETGERTWQLRYAYDFIVLGIPGLTFSTRYNHADHANPATFAGEGREWERDTDLGYTFQSGLLKNVNVLWRNAALRSNYQRDIDENRLIVSYTLPLF
ncbi:outer membrane porin, OprD family [Pseudomonas sp. LB-090624]|uniref:OprD family porin n=1 Tax=Pseudomonas sp. LB-090624 TaxID=2213079 RepID=UPI000D8DBD5D|nr:OprD family porin [Pseudomonas sp. LB-090624]PYB78813.1 outer membrane porin, OprD family [Pseudomonas sp. LB-090624]